MPDTLADESDLILTSPAAALAGVSDDTIRYWARVGRLPFLLTSHGVRLYRRNDVLALVQERKARRSVIETDAQ